METQSLPAVTGYDQQALGKEWAALCGRMCGANVAALNWLVQISQLSLLWDHIADGDPIDQRHADLVLTALMTEWPINPFWQANMATLSLTISNAILAWKSSHLPGQRIKAYDVATEVFCAVAFLLGGHSKAAQYSAEVRALAQRMMEENDQRKATPEPTTKDEL